MRSGRWVCVLGLAGLVGCGPSGPVCDAGGDVVAEASPSGPPPREYVLALSSVVIDTTDDPTVPVFGFNLDGLSSIATEEQDCSKQDSPSALDLDQNARYLVVGGPVVPSAVCGESPQRLECLYDRRDPFGACRGGVDNQAPIGANAIDTIAASGPGGVRAALASHFANQRGTVLVRVAGVDGDPGPTLEDPDIEVQIAAAVPAFSDGCTAAGTNREYALLRSSLRAGGASLRDALFSVPGRIRAGRVEIAADAATTLRFDIGTLAQLRPLGFGPGAPAMHAAHLRFDLGADGSGSRGNFGAFVLGSELVRTAVSVFEGVGFTEDQFAAVIGGLIDVQVDGVCATTSPMLRYGGFGVGYGMTFVPARVATPPVVDAPAPGTCAARP